MGLKKDYLSNFLPSSFGITSKEYFERLKEKGLEDKVLQIPFFALPYKDYDDDEVSFLSSIDYDVHENVAVILMDNDLLDHLDPICCILKQGYVNLILSEINSLSLKSFDKELLLLYRLIKDYKIKRVKFETNKTGNHLYIQNEYLIAATLQLMKDNIFTFTTFMRLATVIENGFTDTPKIKASQRQTLFDLLYYILSNQVCPDLFSQDGINNGKVTNKFCRFIFEFLKVARIVSEEELGYPEENTMRNWITRLPLEGVLEYVKGNFPYFSDHDTFIDTLNTLSLE